AMHSQRRAEELLREVRTLRLGQSSAADVGRIRAKFHRFESASGKCTQEVCRHDIELSNFWIVRDHPRLTSILYSQEPFVGPSSIFCKLLVRTGFHFYRL